MAGLVNRWSVPGSVQLGFLLGQGSEFALVLFSLPAVALLLGADIIAVAISAIAVTMAITPLTSDFGRSLAGKLRSGPADTKMDGDNAPILLVNLGETGRKIADRLYDAEIGYIAIEHDRTRFETAQADGYPVHFLPASDPRSFQSIGLAGRKGVIVTSGSMDRIREIGPLIRDHAPGLRQMVAMDGPDHDPGLDDDDTQFFDTTEDGGVEAISAAVHRLLGMEPFAKTRTG